MFSERSHTQTKLFDKTVYYSPLASLTGTGEFWHVYSKTSALRNCRLNNLINPTKTPYEVVSAQGL